MDREVRAASRVAKSAGHRRQAKAWRTYAPAARLSSRDAELLRHDRPPHDVEGLQACQLEELYRFGIQTRRLEEQLVALKRQNAVVGSVYRSLGQEGAAVGCAYAMRPGDYVQPLIRDLGAALVHGVLPLGVFRQYLARATGPTAGRDLNVHISCPSRGLIGPVSMLGASIPVVAGALLAARLQSRACAGLAFIGDGGSSTGAFYEGLNFACVQRLPLIMVIEANGYAFSTPTSKQLPEGDLLCRARGFGVPVSELDGNDMLACYGATAEARRRALRGGGPTVLLAHTYRRLGHTDHDAQSYADAAEGRAWAEGNDPLTRLRAHLLEGGHIEAAALSAIDAEVMEGLEADRALALADPLPDARTQAHGVWAEDPPGPFPEISTWLGEGARYRSLARQARDA